MFNFKRGAQSPQDEADKYLEEDIYGLMKDMIDADNGPSGVASEFSHLMTKDENGVPSLDSNKVSQGLKKLDKRELRALHYKLQQQNNELEDESGGY